MKMNIYDHTRSVLYLQHNKLDVNEDEADYGIVHEKNIEVSH